jgi:CMP-N-acetylneuraminic acid synthetase
MRLAKKETLAIIPARGGSKGIPRKNIVALCGKPLIAYTIEAALRSALITRLVVSTDDPDIAAVAVDCGAEVPFLRPAELAGDRADLGMALQYTQDRIMSEGYNPKAVVLLFTTSPFRTPAFIDHMVSMLHDGHQSVQTVRRIGIDAAPLYRIDASADRAFPLTFRARHGNGCFRPYGSVAGHRLAPAPKGPYIHYLDDPAMCVDIDTVDDLRTAEAIINNNLFDFETA